jgi:hypothetical protein
VIALEGYPAEQKPDSAFNAIKATLAAAGVDVTAASKEQFPADECVVPPGAATAVQVILCGVGPPAERGDAAKVIIRAPYEFQFLGPFIGWATGDRTLTLATSTVMRTE